MQTQESTYVEVILKRIYGRERFYPCSSDAKLLCTLLESNTLTKEQLKLCKDNGWSVVVKSEEYKLD